MSDEVIGAISRRIGAGRRDIVRADPTIELHDAYIDQIRLGEHLATHAAGDVLTFEADNRTVSYRLGAPVPGRPHRYAHITHAVYIAAADLRPGHLVRDHDGRLYAAFSDSRDDVGLMLLQGSAGVPVDDPADVELAGPLELVAYLEPKRQPRG